MKNYIKNISIALLAGAMLFGGMGCTSSFEDVNKDPDSAADVPNANLLAYTMWFTSDSFYDRWFALDEPMTFCGYVSKQSYIDESRYSYRAGVQNSNWNYVYRTLNNLRDIQARAGEAGVNLKAVADIMEVHVMLIATDRWRDVPYSEAARMDEGILTPKYDKQEDIYPALLAKLKATADVLAAGGSDDVSEGDLLFGGDMLKWQKYCNSMRLRMAIRISEVSPALAQQTIEEILGNPAKYPIMESNDDNAFFWWLGSDSNYYEPVADAYRTRKAEFCASDVMVDYMNENADPRIGIYFSPTAASVQAGTPEYKGYTIGAKSNGVASELSVWGYKYGQDLGGFSPWMRVAEVYFHIAEAAMLGYNTGSYGNAEDNYNKAVRLSMEENGVATADAEAYLAAHKFDGSKKTLWYEEWVAMFKQGMEGWSLYRRTGVPENMYIAPGRPAQYENHNVPPFRSPYPETEMSLNSANCGPFNAEVKDNLWGKQMWFDTREGVY